MVNIKKYPVIFHIGHYGFLWKSILLKLKYHSNQDAIFLFDSSFVNEPTMRFMLEKQKQNNIGRIVIYRDMDEFCDCKCEEDLLNKINVFFKNLLESNNICISKKSTIYSSFDERNAFGIYLINHSIPYILIDDGALNVMNPSKNMRLGENLGKNNYIKLLQNKHALLFDSPMVSDIIWSVKNYPETTAIGHYVDFENIINGANTAFSNMLLDFYNMSNLENICGECNAYFLSSMWGSIFGMNLQEFCEMYGDIISYSSSTIDTILIKPHPNSDLSIDEFDHYFPGSVHMMGYVPSQLLDVISKIKIKKIITTSDSATSIHGSSDVLCLSQRTINCYKEINSPYCIYSVCRLILRQPSFNMNDEQNTYYSRFINCLLDCSYFDESNGFCGIFSSIQSFFNKNWGYDTILIKTDFTSKNLDDISKHFLFVGVIVLKERTNIRNNTSMFIFATNDCVAHSRIQNMHVYKYLYMSRKELEINYISCIDGKKLLLKNKELIEKIKTIKSREVTNYLDYPVDLIWHCLDEIGDYKYGLNYVDYIINNSMYEKISDAIFMCTQLYKKGLFEAAGKLGLIYKRGLYVKKDLYLASKYLRIAADNHINWAKTELFEVYWKIDSQYANKELVKFCTNLLDNDDRGAQGWLARAYRYGKGVEKDLSISSTLYRLSADNGVGWAKNELMDLLWSINTKQSHEELLAYVTNLSSKDDEYAIRYLIKLFKESDFIENNKKQVIYWENYLSKLKDINI